VGVTGVDEFGVFDLDVLRVAGIRVLIACSRGFMVFAPAQFAVIVVGPEHSTDPKFDASSLKLPQEPFSAAGG
jgi:hypothetical protein